jgi:hypothetical protein
LCSYFDFSFVRRKWGEGDGEGTTWIQRGLRGYPKLTLEMYRGKGIYAMAASGRMQYDYKQTNTDIYSDVGDNVLGQDILTTKEPKLNNLDHSILSVTDYY